MTFYRRRTAVLLAAAILVGAGFGLGRATDQDRLRVRAPRGGGSGTSGLPAPLNAGRIQELWHVLHEKYAGPLDDADLAEGALRGIAAGTSDPYTTYANPEESRQFESELSGAFTGVGIEIGLRRGAVTVIAPLRGSPAERAGIRARDIIVKIDGDKVNHALTLTEVVSKIRGPAGTEVKLTVVREGADEPLEFTVRRERISLESVKLELRGGVAVITLSGFNEDTARRFRRAARELLAAGAQGILLDVRNNPGGILDQAVTIAGHFLPRDSLVVTEVPKEGEGKREHRTEGPADLANLPTVVLLNGGSASAAEILAAALHDQRNVSLVGETTFGKGSVQELIELSDGATLRVTIARWHTPRDQELTEEGIAPTVKVQDPEPEKDPDEILEKGLELLKNP